MRDLHNEKIVMSKDSSVVADLPCHGWVEFFKCFTPQLCFHSAVDCLNFPF